MASAATLETLGTNYTAAPHIFRHKFASQVRSNPTAIVSFVGGDISVQESLKSLIACQGCQLETFESEEEFLARPRLPVPSCLVLDVSLPGLDALDLQKRIAVERSEIPIIFVTGNGDIRTTVEAMKPGAVDFLVKPVSNDVLLRSICESLERSRIALDHQVSLRDLQDGYASLTPRERQVMALVVSGLLNKQVACAGIQVPYWKMQGQH